MQKVTIPFRCILIISCRNYIISKQSTISFRNPLHHEFIHYIINKHTTSCKNYIKSEQSTISFRHSLYHAKTHYIIQHSLSCRNYIFLKHVSLYTTQLSFSCMLKIKSSTIFAYNFTIYFC